MNSHLAVWHASFFFRLITISRPTSFNVYIEKATYITEVSWYINVCVMQDIFICRRRKKIEEKKTEERRNVFFFYGTEWCNQERTRRKWRRSYSDIKKGEWSNRQGCKERRKKRSCYPFFSASCVRVIHHEMAMLFTNF